MAGAALDRLQPRPSPPRGFSLLAGSGAGPAPPGSPAPPSPGGLAASRRVSGVNHLSSLLPPSAMPHARDRERDASLLGNGSGAALSNGNSPLHSPGGHRGMGGGGADGEGLGCSSTSPQRLPGDSRPSAAGGAKGRSGCGGQGTLAIVDAGS